MTVSVSTLCGNSAIYCDNPSVRVSRPYTHDRTGLQGWWINEGTSVNGLNVICVICVCELWSCFDRIRFRHIHHYSKCKESTINMTFVVKHTINEESCFPKISYERLYEKNLNYLMRVTRPKCPAPVFWKEWTWICKALPQSRVLTLSYCFFYSWLLVLFFPFLSESTVSVLIQT